MKNRSVSAWLAAASVALLALGSSGAAQARGHVYWSAGVALPGVVVGVGNGYSVYTTPAPTHYAPPPRYYAPPAGYYAPPPAYYPPQSGYYPPPAVYYAPPPPVYGYGYYRGTGRHAHHGYQRPHPQNHYRPYERHDRHDRHDRGGRGDWSR